MMASNFQSSSNTETPLTKRPKLEENLEADNNDNDDYEMAQFIAFCTGIPHLPAVSNQAVPPQNLEIQSSENAGTSAQAKVEEPTPNLLKKICLTRSHIRRLERVLNYGFEDFKNLLQGCLVRIQYKGHNLVEAIKDVEDEERIYIANGFRRIDLEKRIFLPKLGYFEFNKISDATPLEVEIKDWMDRNKSQLPSVEFVQKKISEVLPELLNLENLVHTQEMLIRALLPSHEFVEFLKLREKFPERVNMAIGCMVAYKIRDDPNERLYISIIVAISHDSIQFKHRKLQQIAKLLPVAEEQAIDEDAFGIWLEEMDNWNEQLPEKGKEFHKKNSTLEMINQTLQCGPSPLENPIKSPKNKELNLVIRPEDIGVLLTGLDQREFRQVLTGMFVNFDFGNVKKRFKIRSISMDALHGTNLRHHWALPVCDVTFEPNVQQDNLPFLPPHLRSNALLHIDTNIVVEDSRGNRISSLPIPQTRELIKPSSCGRLKQFIKYSGPSQAFVKSKVQQFWQALEKAKRVPVNPDQANVLPVPKLPKREQPIPVGECGHLEQFI